MRMPVKSSRSVSSTVFPGPVWKSTAFTTRFPSSDVSSSSAFSTRSDGTLSALTAPLQRLPPMVATLRIWGLPT